MSALWTVAFIALLVLVAWRAIGQDITEDIDAWQDLHDTDRMEQR